jgi:uncharacterized protein (DUF2164 family)
MRIALSSERRAILIRAIKAHFEEELDEVLTDFRAEGLLDFFVRELGPAVYNQGVRDACAAIQDKLGDLEGEVYEKERERWTESSSRPTAELSRRLDRDRDRHLRDGSRPLSHQPSHRITESTTPLDTIDCQSRAVRSDGSQPASARMPS